MSANIIARMGEPLPRLFRGAGQWLALSRKNAPLGKAISETFGENVNAHAFGHWLKKHEGTSTEGVTLTGRYSTHKKMWLYHVGEPPPAIVPRVEYSGPPLPCPRPVSRAPETATARTERIAAALAPKPKPVAPPRPTVRFTVPGIVDDANGVSRFTEEYRAPVMNPYTVAQPPRQEPYVPTMPPNAVRQILPSPRLPGVTYSQNGTRTTAHGSGRSYSPFDF